MQWSTDAKGVYSPKADVGNHKRVVGSIWAGGEQNKSFQTCEMHCVCEILFRYETYVLRRADLYHFTENFSFLFNNIMNQLLTMKYCCQNIIYSFVLTDFLYIPGETPTFLEK